MKPPILQVSWGDPIFTRIRACPDLGLTIENNKDRAIIMIFDKGKSIDQKQINKNIRYWVKLQLDKSKQLLNKYNKTKKYLE